MPLNYGVFNDINQLIKKMTQINGWEALDIYKFC